MADHPDRPHGALRATRDRSDRRSHPPDTDPQVRVDRDDDPAVWQRVPRGEEIQTPRRKKAWGLWRGLKFLFGGPFRAVGADRIAESASLIGGLARHIRTGSQADHRVLVYDDRTLDLDAMACDAGLSVAQVRILLDNRRRQTRRAVFCYLAGASAFFALWVWQAAATPAYTSIAYVAVLILICGLFCLSAFYNALVNWQCRTERLGNWREFLSTEDSWWPS